MRLELETLHDIVIIGSGPGGLACAIQAAEKGLSYLLIEKGSRVFQGIIDSYPHHPQPGQAGTKKEQSFSCLCDFIYLGQSLIGRPVMEFFTERHSTKIYGELSCLDRVVISGNIPGIRYADGMSGYLRSRGILFLITPRWAETLRDRIRQNAQALADQEGLSIEHLRNSSFRKEALVREVPKKRGAHEGLTCIFSAMEARPGCKPRHGKPNGRTLLKGD